MNHGVCFHISEIPPPPVFLTHNINKTLVVQICNFGIDSKVALHCLLQHAGDYKEAAEIGYLIDDAVEAGGAAARIKGY